MSSLQRRRRAKPMQEGRKAPYVIVGHWIAFHPDLAPQAKAVYLVMLAYANGEELSSTGSAEIWPAREAIAEAMGWSRPQSCDQWIDQLEAAGAIDVLPPEPGDADRNNHYVVHGTPPEGYTGPQSQAEFSAARRAKRGSRKGDAVDRTTSKSANPQVRDDAVERTTRTGGAAERTTGDAARRTEVMRSTASKKEPVTRTSEKEGGGGAAAPAAAALVEAPAADAAPPPPSELSPDGRRRCDPAAEWTWVCRKHWDVVRLDREADIPDCYGCKKARTWCVDRAAAAAAERRAAAEAEAAQVAAAVARADACPMCTTRSDGDPMGDRPRLDGSGVAVLSPWTACDHVTPLAVVLAEQAAAAAERDQVRAAAEAASREPIAAAGRAAARELFQPKRPCAPRASRASWRSPRVSDPAVSGANSAEGGGDVARERAGVEPGASAAGSAEHVGCEGVAV